MDSFVIVFDIMECGYRGIGWGLSLGGLLLVGLIYLLLFKPDSRGEWVYRLVLSSIWLVLAATLSIYHFRGYTAYADMLDSLKEGRAKQTKGVISYVQAEGYFLYFDVAGERFRSSRSQWPYRLGFQPEEFSLQKGFLARVTTENNVIVRLEIHKIHLSES